MLNLLAITLPLLDVAGNFFSGIRRSSFCLIYYFVSVAILATTFVIVVHDTLVSRDSIKYQGIHPRWSSDS